MNIRERLEAEERTILPAYAQLSSTSRGRARPDPEDPMRPAFQRDLDRIVQCKSFRRLAYKTQVFLSPEGDHYRTRITHTLEVAQVARTITRALGLNGFLAEAVAMGHDLGHTPFGHAGESALAHLVPGGFHHARQSLRVVDQLENDGAGLNLCHEVRDGILKHSKGKGPIVSTSPSLLAMTLEGQVVRLADIIAYVNHDLDDAVRAELLTEAEIPESIRRVLGEGPAARAERLVWGVVSATRLEAGVTATQATQAPQAMGNAVTMIRMDEAVLGALGTLRDFLYDRVYEKPAVKGEFDKARRILGELWEHYHQAADEFRTRWWPKGTKEEEGIDRAIADFISGMTDRYALRAYEELRLPRRWSIY